MANERPCPANGAGVPWHHLSKPLLTRCNCYDASVISPPTRDFYHIFDWSSGTRVGSLVEIVFTFVRSGVWRLDAFSERGATAVLEAREYNFR